MIIRKMSADIRPPSRRLSRPPAAICAKLASRPRIIRLSCEPAKKNNRLSRRTKCGLITDKSIITVFNICKLFAATIFVVTFQCSYVFLVFICKAHLVFMYKTHLLSLHCSDNKTYPWLNIVHTAFPFCSLGRAIGLNSLNLIGPMPSRSVYYRKWHTIKITFSLLS